MGCAGSVTVCCSPKVGAEPSVELLSVNVDASPTHGIKAEEISDDTVAIIGIGCKVPGADNIRQFWNLLQNGENHISEVPTSRWNADAFYDKDPTKPGMAYVKRAGFVQHPEDFDNALFGINDFEAASMDPQQRFVLECTHMALEDAGIAASCLAGTNTGVFIGSMTADYGGVHFGKTSQIDGYAATGLSNSVIAARVSYVYNLLGPSMVIDTACSSSLVAIHQGIQAIRNGDCDMAICGGVNYIGAPGMFVQLTKTQMISPTGQSKAFSAEADGYTRGEGCGIVVLKRLKDARNTNDRVRATVVSGVNQDGHTVTPMNAPSGSQQEKLMSDIYTKYNVDVSRLDYIEAHGTGTKAGDPVEANALGNFFNMMGQPRTRHIGSVKTNIGHLEAAAGVIGVIKVLLMMKHDTIVPSLHCQRVNPLIDLEKLRFAIPQSLVKWESKDKMACCNSFGFGGTNSHVVLQTLSPLESLTRETRRTNVVCFSGKTKQSVMGSMGTITEMESLSGSFKDEHSDEGLLTSIAYTSSVRRDHYLFRKAVVVDELQDLFDSVSQLLRDDFSLLPTKNRHVVFVFCGMGTTRPGMCMQMMEAFPVFKDTMLQIDAILSLINKEKHWSLVDRLSEEDPSKDPLLSPIAIFACQVALVALWKSLGVSPDCVVGQSVGEVAAAYTAGCLSLEAAVRVIYYRSKVLESVTGGKMMVIKKLSVEKVREHLLEFNEASIALEYSPVSCAVSADSDTMTRIQQKLTGEENVQLIPLNVPVAYHSQFVESCKHQLAIALDKLDAHLPKTFYISAVTGEKMISAPGQSYWVSHLREPVLFHKAVQNAKKESPSNTVFLEIGPKSVLKAHMADIFTSENVPLIESMYKPPEEKVFLQAAAALYQLGVDLKWETLYKGCQDISDVPRYVFNKKSSFKRTEMQAMVLSGTGLRNTHLFLYSICTGTFKIVLSPFTTPFIYDHIVSHRILIPGALYLEAALAVAKESTEFLSHHAVVSAAFKSPVSAHKDDLIELEVTPEKNSQAKKSIDLRLFVRKQERDIATINIDWFPVTHASPKMINLQNIRDKCTDHITKEDIYFTLKRLGFEYGQTFSLLEHAYRCEEECLTLIKVIPKVSKDFVCTTIHPCVLDAMLQSAVVLDGNKDTGDLQLLPESMKSLNVFSAMETVMYVHCRRLCDEEKRTRYMLSLSSAQGRVLATIDEFVVAKLGVNNARATLPPLMNMAWIATCPIWNVGTVVVADAFILHTAPPADDENSKNGKNVKFLSKAAIAKEWDEIQEEVAILMTDAGQAGAIVVVCHTDLSDNVTCDDLDMVILNTCGAIYSVLKLAHHLHLKQPIYVCTFGAWPEGDTFTEKMRVNSAATAIWGMTRTAQSENVYPRLATVDIHIPPPKLTSTFFSLMAQSLSSSPELKEHSEVLITTESVYINRIRHVHKQTTIPVLRDAPFDPREDCLVVSEQPEEVARPFALKVSTSREMSPGDIVIKPEVFALASPYLNRTVMVQEESMTGSSKYSVFALETVGRPEQEHNSLTVTCCPVQVGSRISVHPDTAIPRSLMPGYQLGDLTKLVLLFALSEKVTTDDVTILTSASHLALSHVLKMILETKEAKDKMTVNIQESRNLASAKVDSQTVVSFILLDTDAMKSLARQWSHAARLVTCSPLITPEALTCLTCLLPNTEVLLVDTELLYRPWSLRQLVPKVKAWLSKLNERNVKNLHLSSKTYSLNSDPGSDMLTSMLTFRELTLNNVPVKADSQNLFSACSVYVVVGGLAGLGWICVKFLAKQGAKNIAIIQRRSPSAENYSNIEQVSSQFHCNIRVFQADVTSLECVQEALSSIGKSFNQSALKGIFFGAAVLEDCSLSLMNRDKFDKALAPKVKGTWNFHRLTKHLPLDFFVMHSSAASVLGNQGQANYAAGNAFLDGLAHYRRHLGLSAQSFSWGALATGLLDNNTKSQQKLESMGFLLMSETEIRESLTPLLMLNWPHCAPIKLDEKRYLQRLKGSDVRPLLLRLEMSASLDVKSMGADVSVDISTARSKDPAARLEIYSTYIRLLASRVLSVDPALVTLDTSLASLGLDSVSSMMIVDQVYRDTSVKLPTISLISGEATAGSIAQALNNNVDISSAQG